MFHRNNYTESYIGLIYFNSLIILLEHSWICKAFEAFFKTSVLPVYVNNITVIDDSCILHIFIRLLTKNVYEVFIPVLVIVIV